MPLPPLIGPNASDAGGVAGRRGFRFQDHVAARFLLQLLHAENLAQVECETGDDIALRWDDGTHRSNEYVQVKTTDSDSKWSLGEICQRTPAGAAGTSLVERSLGSEAFPGPSMFRFISVREIRHELAPLKISREKRFDSNEAHALGGLAPRIAKRLAGAVSPQGTTVDEWVHRTLWETVGGGIQALRLENVNALLRLAEADGECLLVSAAAQIYDELVGMAAAAGDASRALNPTAKVITKSDISSWWKEKVVSIRQRNQSFVKVYQFATPSFFTELHRINEEVPAHSMASYDAEFDGGAWRKDDLCEYLIDWLPEVSLSARVLAQTPRLETRRQIHRALESFDRSRLDEEALLAQLLLHAILRHYKESEPLTCKIFSVSGSHADEMNAHIVSNPSGDELWLGQSHITATRDFASVISAVVTALGTTLDRSFLKKEREIIFQFREPQHLRPTNIDRIFERHSKIDDLIKVLNLPVLVAYDSVVLAEGFADDYVARLQAEVEDKYRLIKGQFSEALNKVRIHVFLVPVQGAATLLEEFKVRLRRV
ncbi:Hachiman antiphage defense system protein HamA [uncultured Agrobacterium sp.]|uniref:HamA C-terminal domain-containing protein n=1 Tax=uncultured Agrobacterium sp. TaxID=157277 RepID=UPI0025DCE5CA|nr:Hachiman antiphage defense system protein HamA [uncultured Agrobacterium sp.]